jgi:hypothetical protein
VLRLASLFVGGFLTWGLVVLRGIALEKRRASWLGSLIFADDCLAVGFGMWLARHGTVLDVVACAAGGACAAMLLVVIDRRKHGRDAN